jgi:hypothetical protein
MRLVQKLYQPLVGTCRLICIPPFHRVDNSWGLLLHLMVHTPMLYPLQEYYWQPIAWAVIGNFTIHQCAVIDRIVHNFFQPFANKIYIWQLCCFCILASKIYFSKSLNSIMARYLA